MKIQTTGTTTQLSVNIENWTLKTVEQGTSRQIYKKSRMDKFEEGYNGLQLWVLRNF